MSYFLAVIPEHPVYTNINPGNGHVNITVQAGNTYCVWDALKESRAIEEIQNLVNEGAIYLGDSAGAIVAGDDIRAPEVKGWDDPNVVNTDWNAPRAKEAMKIISGKNFFPHAREKYEGKLKEVFGNDLENVIRLKDGEGIYWDNEKVENTRNNKCFE